LVAGRGVRWLLVHPCPGRSVVARRGRPGLTPDRRAEIAMDAMCSNLAIALSRTGADQAAVEAAGVAQMSLLAPGRTDLLDAVAATIAEANRFGDWPPKALQLQLLERTRRVLTGQTALVGPGGVRVEHVLVPDGAGVHGPDYTSSAPARSSAPPGRWMGWAATSTPANCAPSRT
jgi:hypothetical protein